MSASASNLSNSHYGYHFVVAVTEASINATLKAFMATLQEPVVTVCYVADGTDSPTQMDYEKFKTLAGGTNPFTMPNDADPEGADVQNLLKARFMSAFRAQLGIPPVQDPATLPDIVTLSSDISAVEYNMFCSEFTIVHLNPSGDYAPLSFTSISQPSDNPWYMQSTVNLNLSARDNSGYADLPVDAHCDADGLSSDMSVDFTPGGQASLTETSGATVLSYSYTASSSDDAGSGGALGSLYIGTTYNMETQFTNINGNASVVISQNLIITCDMKRNFTVTDGNIVDKTIVDTYTLAVDESGTLGATMISHTTDNSVTPSTDDFQDFFTGSNEVASGIKEQAGALVSSNLHDIPLSVLQKYIFPGGQTFAFKDVRFSNNQDLLASISHVDPTAPPPNVPS
ncbi:hypothetical protein BKA56DRAFT_691286 [Ilyonectria sp. MPI-CAGE-AT-0026]|nr:hypothetical protein BKA56DRAFT_691286 [Ilyonectria sp. MPI-CAGE-AT-0026]